MDSIDKIIQGVNLKVKHITVLRLLLLLVATSWWSNSKMYSQREPQYTQYMYNIGNFNPAYVGSVETMDISGLYRAQWIDIPGAPRNLRFGINYPLENETMGLGFNVVSDELGPATNTFVDVAYSYQIKVSDETKLSFGIDAGAFGEVHI